MKCGEGLDLSGSRPPYTSSDMNHLSKNMSSCLLNSLLSYSLLLFVCGTIIIFVNLVYWLVVFLCARTL